MKKAILILSLFFITTFMFSCTPDYRIVELNNDNYSNYYNFTTEFYPSEEKFIINAIRLHNDINVEFINNIILVEKVYVYEIVNGNRILVYSTDINQKGTLELSNTFSINLPNLKDLINYSKESNYSINWTSKISGSIKIYK